MQKGQRRKSLNSKMKYLHHQSGGFSLLLYLLPTSQAYVGIGKVGENICLSFYHKLQESTTYRLLSNREIKTDDYYWSISAFMRFSITQKRTKLRPTKYGKYRIYYYMAKIKKIPYGRAAIRKSPSEHAKFCLFTYPLQ